MSSIKIVEGADLFDFEIAAQSAEGWKDSSQGESCQSRYFRDDGFG